jgi:phage shock protein A
MLTDERVEELSRFAHASAAKRAIIDMFTGSRAWERAAVADLLAEREQLVRCRDMIDQVVENAEQHEAALRAENVRLENECRRLREQLSAIPARPSKQEEPRADFVNAKEPS